jgi:uncharacterized UPF0160 family protein
MASQECQPRSFGTHNGTFHADEVTACALLVVAGRIDRNRVVRSRDPQKLARCEYVADVGGVYEPLSRLFDHHQADYQGEMASAGMILDYLVVEGVFSAKLAAHLRAAFIWGVDAVDTGRFHPVPGVCTFSQVIANFNPIAYEADADKQDAAFQEALSFTIGHLQRLIGRFEESQAALQAVQAAMEPAGPALIFERAVPWQDAFFELGGEHHPARFVIMPAGPHWKLRAIPPTAADRMGVREPLPQSWAGLLNDELERVSGISGAVFCHKGRFISVWATRQAAEEALQAILGQQQ